jgi:hypothetical protein
VNGKSQQQHPWLTDSLIFLGFRWSSWGATVGFALWAGMWEPYSWLFVLSGLANLLATGMVQTYVHAARRNPSVLGLDILYMTLVLLPMSNGWNGPFIAHAASALVLPALLFGWRGGIMAGLAFVPLDLGANWAARNSPATMIERQQYTTLLTMMIAPPLFGYVFAWGVAIPRRVLAQRQRKASQRRPLIGGADFKREPGENALDRFAAVVRDHENRQSAAQHVPLVSPATAVRTTEPGAEELRRVLFSPLPSDDIDLPAMLDVLSIRFGKHTGIATNVTVLGRARLLHHAQRLVLVRLTQEALINVQQHAHASSTSFTLRYDSKSVALMVQDDGVGLLDGTYERPGLHALRAMQYRVNELGGRMDVFETEGGGVTVRATMPLD